jgi:hypothetical protein
MRKKLQIWTRFKPKRTLQHGRRHQQRWTGGSSTAAEEDSRVSRVEGSIQHENKESCVIVFHSEMNALQSRRPLDELQDGAHTVLHCTASVNEPSKCVCLTEAQRVHTSWQRHRVHLRYTVRKVTETFFNGGGVLCHTTVPAVIASRVTIESVVLGVTFVMFPPLILVYLKTTLLLHRYD